VQSVVFWHTLQLARQGVHPEVVPEQIAMSWNIPAPQLVVAHAWQVPAATSRQKPDLQLVHVSLVEPVHTPQPAMQATHPLTMPVLQRVPL